MLNERPREQNKQISHKLNKGNQMQSIERQKKQTA